MTPETCRRCGCSIPENFLDLYDPRAHQPVHYRFCDDCQIAVCEAVYDCIDDYEVVA